MRAGAVLFSFLTIGAATLLVAQIPSPNPDLNRDGIVDAADQTIVKNSYGKRCGQAGFNPIADVNRDCVVNLTDLTYVTRANGTRVADVLQVAAAASPAANAQGWNKANVRVSFTCTGTIPGDTCPAAIDVTSDGANQAITGTGTDTFGHHPSATATVNLDKTAPGVTIDSPVDAATVTGSTVHVTGSATDTLSGIASVTCNNAPATRNGNAYSCDVPPGTPGPFTISVGATDVAGNTAGATRNITIGTTTPPPRQGPTIAIDSPAPLALFNRGPIDVSGRVDDPNATVLVNGVAGGVSGGTFMARGVPLREGSNLLTATATNAGGGVGTATRSVVVDGTPPTIRIDAPSDNAVLTSSQVTVTGVINDIVNGTVNAEQASVTVNGLPATVSNRTFVLPDLLLVRGPNALTAVARDRAGNESRTEVHVTVQDVTGQQRVVLVSGNNQQGEIGTALPGPLVAQLVDAGGRPVAGRPITFTVRRSDGVLSSFGSQGQQITLQSDANGQASVSMQLGTRTGVGNNEVVATAPGFVGEVIFCQSSVTAAPNAINVAMGDTQRGVLGQSLGMPLITIVTDRGGNPARGVPVTYRVAQGGGNLGGVSEIALNTDGDGKAAAFLTLGVQEGINNNVVNATFEGLVGAPATFTASGVLAGSAANTRVSGVVLDNTDKPIPHAQAKIVDTNLSAFTDDQGHFSILNAPVGTITLIVDGSMSTRSETFPFLAFQLSTIAGSDNTLGMSIYLPPLDAQNSKIVGGNEDVVLTMKDVPGYSFTIFAHSVTFTDGSHVGPLSLSQVHADKVPMAPPNGTAPRIAGTLQPAGAHFNPPIRVQFPNVEGLTPGTVIDVVSFDHDLEDWVSGGPARVSPDGSVITSDPGFGIAKSGWHFPPPPPPPKKCVGSAPACQKCDSSTGTFVADSGQDNSACADGDQSQTSGGITYKVADSCKGTCTAGTCKASSDGFSVSSAMAAAKGAGDKTSDACMGDPLKTKVHDALKKDGFNIVCDKNGSDCASAAPGSNTLTLTPAAYKVASCDALDSSVLHEIVHASGGFRHRKCKADGTVLGEISCGGVADCEECIDADTDKSYGCERSCFPATGSTKAKASACK